ncbi:MAG: glutamate--tRNA ligase [Betaproteobacteria bacterium RIFCSPLOWO2_12_FULL_67_28]|nr:MAG: glutamate--tRNA ligase [Betaproteobacteria bacterium RIFCSPLOWO2_12_FULL_67_28]
MTAIRTRFAPSPTGFLHVGGARTALYAWAFARKHGGSFVLRIEDTDLERSTGESVETILASLRWLGIGWDEGPFFQMKRLARYMEVAEELIAAGHAYYCWATKDELEAMREAQRARGVKPRYDGRWRPERARAAGLAPPTDRPPVVRFRTPEAGEIGWYDLVKGAIAFPNAELDDLVLLRADGVPTYNFGVVVDDLDMGITHVIRGDDHVNNTPRQIHIFHALGAKMPEFGHVPMILGADGERLSKRHGAVSVTQYRDDGFLPEALVNYLARLGWSHGDDEIFSAAQLVEWFDLAHVSRSPAQFDPGKLAWLNQQYLKQADDARLAKLVAPALRSLGVDPGAGPALDKVVALLKDRATTILHLAEAARLFYQYETPSPAKLAELVTERTRPALKMLETRLADVGWERRALGETVSGVLKSTGLKMPELAMPVRLLVTGRTQTPSLDAVLELLGRETVLARLSHHLNND